MGGARHGPSPLWAAPWACLPWAMPATGHACYGPCLPRSRPCPPGAAPQAVPATGMPATCTLDEAQCPRMTIAPQCVARACTRTHSHIPPLPPQHTHHIARDKWRSTPSLQYAEAGERSSRRRAAHEPCPGTFRCRVWSRPGPFAARSVIIVFLGISFAPGFVLRTTGSSHLQCDVQCGPRRVYVSCVCYLYHLMCQSNK